MFELRKTPLHNCQVALGARMVGFAGWSMPVQYQGLVAEHEAVRNQAGVFDVSHMGELLVEGPDAEKLLQSHFSNNLERLSDRRSQYTLLTNEQGGVIDDAMIYRWDRRRFVVVVNAANRELDLAALVPGNLDVQIRDLTFDCALLAVQGPKTRDLIASLVEADLAPVRRTAIIETTIAGRPCWLARTGYTGEDGFELFLENGEAPFVFQTLLDAGFAPAGLGARNTLRLEAGMALHGHELSDQIDPYSANLGAMVKLDKGPFVGRSALRELQATGPSQRLFGLQSDSRLIPRDGYPVTTDHGPGRISSGSWSPTLKRGIAMAFLPADCQIGDTVWVQVRGKPAPATLCKLPFYSNVRRWRARSSS